MTALSQITFDSPSAKKKVLFLFGILWNFTVSENGGLFFTVSKDIIFSARSLVGGVGLGVSVEFEMLVQTYSAMYC